MPNKLFLETYPLYKKFNVVIEPIHSVMYGGYGGTTLEKLAKPSINMHCHVCLSDQTFNMINNYWDDDKLAYTSSGPTGITFRLKYLCASCKTKLFLFYIEFGEITFKSGKKMKTSQWIRKVGQNPPWEIKVDKKLDNLLGVYSELYKKGMTCESEGYGIGAYAYYRRIVEGIIDKLLDSISELIENDENKEIYFEALARTKNAKDASHKIEIVKDILPPSLTPDGLNPLSIIYSSISQGIHSNTDEHCLELADSIRKSLIFLVEQILNQKKTRSDFTESMKKLLAKK